MFENQLFVRYIFCLNSNYQNCKKCSIIKKQIYHKIKYYLKGHERSKNSSEQKSLTKLSMYPLKSYSFIKEISLILQDKKRGKNWSFYSDLLRS